MGLRNNGEVALTIPNLEVKEIFESTIMRWFDDNAKIWNREQLFTAVWNGDAQRITEELNKLLRRTISYHDYREDFYHAFLAGIFRESGYRAGRYVSPASFCYEERFRINEENISNPTVSMGKDEAILLSTIRWQDRLPYLKPSIRTNWKTLHRIATGRSHRSMIGCMRKNLRLNTIRYYAMEFLFLRKDAL